MRSLLVAAATRTPGQVALRGIVDLGKSRNHLTGNHDPTREGPGSRWSQRARSGTGLALADFFFACRHKGLDGYEMVRYREKARQAHMEVYDELGGFDGQVVPGISFIFPHRLSGIVREPVYKVPAVDLPRDSVIQCDEAEILRPEDYDLIADMGWNAFAEKYYARFNRRSSSDILSWGERQTAGYYRGYKGVE